MQPNLRRVQAGYPRVQAKPSRVQESHAVTEKTEYLKDYPSTREIHYLLLLVKVGQLLFCRLRGKW